MLPSRSRPSSRSYSSNAWSSSPNTESASSTSARAGNGAARQQQCRTTTLKERIQRVRKIKRERVTYQNLNEVPSTIKNTKQRKQEVEAECLSPVLHHQLLHARVGQAYHQEQLSKLLTVLKQVHHDAQQLLLETGRQEPWLEGGASVKEAGKRLCAAMARIEHT